MTPTVERLRELFDYIEETGDLVRKTKSAKRTRVGEVAGYLRNDGYVAVSVDGTQYLAHRIAWAIKTGAWPVEQVDHRNEVKNDNSFTNLRDVSGEVNQQNRAHARADNKLGVLGVSEYRRLSGKVLYLATISAFGKRRRLGIHKTVEAAGAAYMVAKQDLHADAVTAQKETA